jgi:hypothetical protein
MGVPRLLPTQRIKSLGRKVCHHIELMLLKNLCNAVSVGDVASKQTPQRFISQTTGRAISSDPKRLPTRLLARRLKMAADHPRHAGNKNFFHLYEYFLSFW